MGGPGGVVGVVGVGSSTTEDCGAAPPPSLAASSDLAALEPHPAANATSASAATSAIALRQIVPPGRLVTGPHSRGPVRFGGCTRDYDPAISTLSAHGLRGIVPGARRVLGRRAFRTSVPDRLAPVLQRPIVSVVGDSHAAIYNRMRRQGQLPGVWLDALSVPGATAFGLANPNPSTNALTRFSTSLDRAPRHRRTLLVLGEVDCGFLIWHRSMTNGTSVESEFEQSLARYTGFLEEQRAKGHDRLGVVSVAPSTIDDYAKWKGL